MDKLERIERKIDLLFRLCFKDERNYTFGSFFWDEIKECIPLYGNSAKKVDIKDFPTQEEIQKYINKIGNLMDKLKKEFDDYSEKFNEEDRDLRHKQGEDGYVVIQKQRDVLKNQYWDKQEEYNKKDEELINMSDTIETLTYDWFKGSYFGDFNISNCVHIKGLKDSIERNYRAQFVNDVLKKLGIKRREYDCVGYIEKAIEENKQLKEIFKKIDKL